MTQPLYEIDINSSRYSGGMEKSGGKYFYELLAVKNNSRPHYHNCYELEIVLDGTAIQLVDGEESALKKGRITFISPNQIHTINNTRNLELISIKIVPEALSDELKNAFTSLAFPILGELSNEELELFLKLFSAVTKKNTEFSNLYSAAVMHQINSFLCILTQHFGKNSFTNQVEQPKDMLKTVEFIKKNILKPITLKMVANEFGYTPNYFSTKFKGFTGKGFARFVQDERLLLAYRAICTTDTSLNEISANCLFESFPYFSRVFKQKYGKSPALFRERKNKKS